MKTYFKILAITLGIQLISFCLFCAGDQIFNGSMISVCILLSGIIVSMIFGIFLPIRWYDTGKEKFLGILLLPTNYTWLFLVLSVVFFVNGLLGLLTKIPDNFG